MKFLDYLATLYSVQRMWMCVELCGRWDGMKAIMAYIRCCWAFLCKKWRKYERRDLWMWVRYVAEQPSFTYSILPYFQGHVLFLEWWFDLFLFVILISAFTGQICMSYPWWVWNVALSQWHIVFPPIPFGTGLLLSGTTVMVELMPTGG